MYAPGMGKPSNAIAEPVIEFLRGRGAYIWRNVSGGRYQGSASGQRRFVAFGASGISDLMAVYRGKFLAIEIKAGKDRLTDHQRKFAGGVTAAGGLFIECRSVADVAAIVARIDLEAFD